MKDKFKRLEGARVKEVSYRDIYRNEDDLEHLRKADIHAERIKDENSSESS